MTLHDEALALIGRLRYFQGQHSIARRDREPRKAAIANDQIRGLLDSAWPETVREALLTALRPDQQQTMPVVLGAADQARIVSVDEIRLLVEQHGAAVVAWAREGVEHHNACISSHAQLMNAVQALAEAAFVNDVARIQAQSEGRPS